MHNTLKTTPLPGSFDLLETPLEHMPPDILYPFAWDERMCRLVGQGRKPAVHIWRHPLALVVGLRDRRLPQAEAAMNRLRAEGISVGVRNSGGAAVPLDAGVVNVSIVLPNPVRTLDFHDDFRMMVQLISDSLKPWRALADAGEIAGSYCPGDYDVSIGGRKFCGIAQRRQTKAYVVSAFIVVSGSGEERGERVRSFYEEASGNTTEGFPAVRPAVMSSLQHAAGVPSPEAYIAALRRELLLRGGDLIEPYRPLQPAHEVEEMIEQLRDRYDK